MSPRDATLHHMMGVWCYEVASLGWVKRQLASALFGTPPTSTYDEAVAHLLESERLAAEAGRPMFSNRLKLAQAYAGAWRGAVCDVAVVS